MDGDGNINYKDGSINYSLFARFVNPAPRMEIEFILDYKGRVPGGRHEALAIHGIGTGFLTPHAAAFPELQYYQGKVGTIHLPGTKAVGQPSDGDEDGLVFDDSDVVIV